MEILIADDDMFSRTILKRTLVGQGHEVYDKDDGQKAWDLWQQLRTPVVIVDWMMPELDGLELCRRIRAEPSRTYTYIIMLTSKEGRKSYLESINAGADDFLTKPLDNDQLVARLLVAARILELHARNLQLASLIPICMYCKKARDDNDYWRQLDEYLMQQTDTRLSHGICPDCFQKHLPDWAGK